MNSSIFIVALLVIVGLSYWLSPSEVMMKVAIGDSVKFHKIADNFRIHRADRIAISIAWIVVAIAVYAIFKVSILSAIALVGPVLLLRLSDYIHASKISNRIKENELQT